MQLTAIVNSLSGSVPNDGREQMEALLKEHGWPCNFLTPDPENLDDVIKSCAQHDCDAVVVWGGDGTVSSVLQILGPDGPPVIPLPGGTMNMLHQRVHGAVADWQTCLVESILRRRPEYIPAACLNDRLMFIAALTGRIVGLAKAREAVRAGAIAELPNALDLGETLNLETAITFNGDSRNGEVSGQATTLGVFVTEDVRKTEDGLDVIATDPRTIGEMMKIGLQALMTPITQTEGVDHCEAETVTLNFEGVNSLPGTIDGEPVEFESGMTIEFVPRAARVMGAGLA